MHDVARLFDEHHVAVYRYLVHLTREPDLAADGAQEAFVRALTATGEGQEVTRAWLYRVATNFVLDRRRTDGRRSGLLGAGDARAPFGDPPPDPLERLEAADRQAAVAAALAQLSAKERSAVLMREQGFAHREIADALGTTTGSVGTLLARALARIAATLDPQLEHL